MSRLAAALGDRGGLPLDGNCAKREGDSMERGRFCCGLVCRVASLLVGDLSIGIVVALSYGVGVPLLYGSVTWSPWPC